MAHEGGLCPKGFNQSIAHEPEEHAKEIGRNKDEKSTRDPGTWGSTAYNVAAVDRGVQMPSSVYGNLDSETRRKCMCCWSDLLGFRPELGRASYDSDEELRVAVERLRLLQVSVRESLRNHEIHLEPAMFVNDGVARTSDYVTEHGVTFQLAWLARILRTHNAVNATETKAKRPGIRSVLVAGERSTHGLGDQTQQDIWRYLVAAEGIDDPSVLFTPQFAERVAIYSPFEFQLNLAFARAYQIDSRGKSVGLAGARFFIHQSVFDFFTGLPYQDLMGLWGCPVSTVVDIDDALRPGYRYVRIGPPVERIQFVKLEGAVESVPVEFPSMTMLLDEHPITVDGQFVWSVRHFTLYPNFPAIIPLVNVE